MTTPHKAVCPICKATVHCYGPNVTLSSHPVHGNVCAGSFVELCPTPAPEEEIIRDGTSYGYCFCCDAEVALREDGRFTSHGRKGSCVGNGCTPADAAKKAAKMGQHVPFRVQFPTLMDYAATCRPMWQAFREDDALTPEEK